jgi:hypothetical protein
MNISVFSLLDNSSHVYLIYLLYFHGIFIYSPLPFRKMKVETLIYIDTGIHAAHASS